MAQMGRMPRRPDRQPRPPYDEETIERLALFYVGRFATTRARLSDYLGRKVKERGWAGARPFDPAGLADRLAGLGYVDDLAFAEARARSLGARGYGVRRVAQSLRAAGVGEEERASALPEDEEAAWEAALAFARRRRIGPYARGTPDPRERQKQFAALMRAGHGVDVARRLLGTNATELPMPDAD